MSVVIFASVLLASLLATKTFVHQKNSKMVKIRALAGKHFRK